jgi:hypothetical protein
MKIACYDPRSNEMMSDMMKAPFIVASYGGKGDIPKGVLGGLVVFVNCFPYLLPCAGPYDFLLWRLRDDFVFL